jgi:hypothetical protein
VLVVVLAALLGWRIRKHHAERNAEQPSALTAPARPASRPAETVAGERGR